MDKFSLSNLENLTNFGLRGRVDMRPTLLRVLTDLYVQKPVHTPEEERHYTELALRLLEVVDVPTRAVVAARLAKHRAPPLRVIRYLAGDLPDVAAALRPGPQAQSSVTVAQAASNRPANAERDRSTRSEVRAAGKISPEVAHDLNENFFGADPAERRLILISLDFVASGSAQRAQFLRDPAAGKRLEAAALARSHDGFAQELAAFLQISRDLAVRIARDEFGEPIVVAAKALNVPRDLLYRILLFINTAIGHSVERVHALADLYDEISAQAAEDIVAIWQALKTDERAPAKHQPLYWNDEPRRARPSTETQRAAAPTRKIDRRDAS